MDPSLPIVRLPFSCFVLAVCTIVLVVLLCIRLLRSSSSRQELEGIEYEQDWTIPPVDAYSHLSSPFHRWDPRLKMISLLIYVFCAVSVTQLFWAGCAVLIGVASAWATRIPARHIVRRIAAMGGFLTMFLVVMPLSVKYRPGDFVAAFDSVPWVTFNVRGLQVAGLICLKASAIALMMEPLFGTSPVTLTMQALASLRVPQSVCQMVLLSHRYIFVFHGEMKRMTTAMEVRGFRKRTDLTTLRTLGNFVGILLVRSFERTQRVYEAMLARGYRGVFAAQVEFRAGRADWAKGLLWVVLGAMLIGADRLLQVSLL